MRHACRKILWLGPILAFGLIACGTTASEDAGSAVSTATPVKTIALVRQRLADTLTFTATLEAWRKINITPETAGKVAKILVEEGQPVQKGQVLAELETESLRLQLGQAEAGLAAAEANFAVMVRNKDRMDRLRGEKAVSEQQYEQVKLGHDAAKAQLDQARAGVNLARHYLDASVLSAPWNGVVASKNAQVGDVINPLMGGFAPASGILTLMDFSRVKIVLDVGPADVGRIRKGQPAQIRPAEGGEFPGTVSLVGQTADALSKKFRVEVTAANPEGKLRPGTFGTAVLEIAGRDAVLAVPQRAVVDNRYVFVAQGGKAVRREVIMGLQTVEFAEIVSGLREGDAVIVEGNYGLSDGAPIAVR